MNEDLIFDLCYPSWGTQDFDGRMEKPESGIRNPESGNGNGNGNGTGTGT